MRLVGLGPGHPGLITVQAAAAIKEADTVRFTGESELVHLARLEADVGPFTSAEEVVEQARAGRRVAVLFPGDPYAFSSGSQLAERLQRAGIEFDAIPGLLVETAAPTLGGIPLTIEGRAASVGLGLVKGAETVVVRLRRAGWKPGSRRSWPPAIRPASRRRWSWIRGPRRSGVWWGLWVSCRGWRPRSGCAATRYWWSAPGSTSPSGSTSSPSGLCTGGACW